MRQLNARKPRKRQGAKRILHEILPSEKRSEVEQHVLNAGLYNSAIKGNIAGMKRALEGGADINMSSEEGVWNTLLHTTVIHNQGKACAFLIKKGADLFATGDSGHTPLQVAAKWGRSEIMRIIADGMAGALVGRKNEEAFISSFRACVSS
jgi:ankyrin repeat protein